jgi:hypothetical protein
MRTPLSPSALMMLSVSNMLRPSRLSSASLARSSSMRRSIGHNRPMQEPSLRDVYNPQQVLAESLLQGCLLLTIFCCLAN